MLHICCILQVIEHGELKQHDTPSRLMKDVDGLFYHMVQQAGEREKTHIKHMLACRVESTRL